MDNGYDIVWRWKLKEYKYVNRLFAKIMDLLIVYIVTLGVNFLLVNIGVDLDIKMKYRLILLIYFIYEMVLFVIMKTTIGKWIFHMKYLSKDGANSLNQFVIRTIIYLALVAISIEFKLITPIILYYLIKAFDSYSGPFWDFNIKVVDQMQVYILKYIGVFIAFIAVIVLSFQYSTLLQDYTNDYKEFGIEPSFIKGFRTSLNDENFNDDIYAMYIVNDYEGIISSYVNNEFTGLANSVSYNYLGLAYMEMYEAQEAIEAFDYALSIADEDDFDLTSALHNNLSWAYNDLEEYEKSIEEAKLAIKLGDKSTYVYTNYANALYNLERYEEAITRYEDAIKAKDYEDNFVYTMIAECYYQLEDYENATKYFEQYKEIDSTNPQSYYDLGWAKALTDNDYTKGLDDINKMVELSEYSSEAVVAKAEYLNDFSQYELMIEYLTNDVEEELVLEHPDLSYYLLVAYNQVGQYEEGIELGNSIIKSGVMDLSVWYTVQDLYYNNGDYDNIKNLILNYQINSEDNAETLLEVAYMYSYNYFYKESGAIYKDLVSNPDDYDLSNEQWEDALYEWLLILYDSDDFDTFIVVCNQYKDAVEMTNLYHFLGLGYYELGENELAEDNYLKAIGNDPEGNYMYEDLIYLYIQDGDYDKARKYLTEAKSKGLNDEAFDEINDYLNDYTQTKPGELIFEFIESNYMYYNDSKELRDLKDKLITKNNISDQEFMEINRVAFGSDYFSFIFNGQDFREYMAMEEEATVSSNWINDDHLYVKIDFFSYLTDTEFLRVIKAVENSKDKTLIIDVRGNFGGDLDSAMNIIDYLTGNGYIGEWDSPLDEPYPYYSDGDFISFKEIFIMTDDESASSSEVIALGITEYVENSYIIGETTYGKGVGQVSMNNLKYEYALFVVNAYWNINDLNIHEVGIEPDIELIDASYEDYINAILTY